MVARMVVGVACQGVVAHAFEQLLQVAIRHSPPTHLVCHGGIAPIPVVRAIPLRVEQSQSTEHRYAPGALGNGRAVKALDQQCRWVFSMQRGPGHVNTLPRRKCHTGVLNRR